MADSGYLMTNKCHLLLNDPLAVIWLLWIDGQVIYVNMGTADQRNMCTVRKKKTWAIHGEAPSYKLIKLNKPVNKLIYHNWQLHEL